MSKHTPGYEVTQDGRVFSVWSNWRGYGRREISQSLNSDGYPSVRIMINGKRVRCSVHKLVALHHLEDRPSDNHEIRHLDGNKMNPNKSNLAWGTAKDNADDRNRHGTTSMGIKHSIAIRSGRADAITQMQRDRIKQMSECGTPQRKIALAVGCSQAGVSYVIRSKL